MGLRLTYEGSGSKEWEVLHLIVEMRKRMTQTHIDKRCLAAELRDMELSAPAAPPRDPEGPFFDSMPWRVSESGRATTSNECTHMHICVYIYICINKVASVIQGAKHQEDGTHKTCEGQDSCSHVPIELDGRTR